MAQWWRLGYGPVVEAGVWPIGRGWDMTQWWRLEYGPVVEAGYKQGLVFIPAPKEKQKE